MWEGRVLKEGFEVLFHSCTRVDLFRIKNHQAPPMSLTHTNASFHATRLHHHHRHKICTSALEDQSSPLETNNLVLPPWLSILWIFLLHSLVNFFLFSPTFHYNEFHTSINWQLLKNIKLGFLNKRFGWNLGKLNLLTWCWNWLSIKLFSLL